MKKHATSSYDRRTDNVRQSYGSPTNPFDTYDSRKEVLQVCMAAVRISKTVIQIHDVQVRSPYICDFVAPIR